MDHHTKNRKALVLGGGSIKGAWQAGAIKAVFESGFIPDIIIGISAGANNSAFMTNEIGKIRSSGHTIKNWAIEIGDPLINFWLSKITCPRSIIKKKSILKTLFDIIRKKFNGMVSIEPLSNILDEVINCDNIIESGIDLRIGTVNINNGKIIYADSSFPHFKEYIKGSSAIPILMPIVHIDEQPFLDGGLRDSAGLKEAIDAGATEIIVIGTNPEDIGVSNINCGNINEVMDRVTNIISNNNLNGDIQHAQLINKLLEDGQYKRKPKVISKHLDGKKFVDMKVIRPFIPMDISITKFTTSDIESMISNGYETAKKTLGVS